MMQRRAFLKSAALICAALAAGAIAPGKVLAASYHRIVILGDPHLPGRDIDRKEQVLETINSWKDVEMVVAVGDICSQFGTDEEYRAAKIFFGKLRPPVFPITGNHDYLYADPVASNTSLIIGTPAAQEAKLRMFQQTFGLPSLYYSRHAGGYLLVFLAADHAEFYSGMSDRQLAWLRTELKNNPKMPTIIFFHGPLKGTHLNYRPWVNTPNFIAQPWEALHEILAANRQVFLWVSGHTHTPPLEASYASPVNLYDGRVTNIHNKDMNRGTIWTNSLFLYPEKVVVKTYNHQDNVWLRQIDRTILPPKL